MTSNTSDTSSLRPQLKKAATWSIAMGILMVIAGIFAVSLPLTTGIAVAIWLGWIFSFVGVLQLVYAWQTRDEGGFILKLLVGLLYTGAGIFLVFNPLKGVVTLTLALATFLLIEGIFELVLAFRMRSLSPSWPWVLGHAIITLILGAVIWLGWPSSSTWVIGLLVGINIISRGISRIIISSAARKVLSAQPG